MSFYHCMPPSEDIADLLAEQAENNEEYCRELEAKIIDILVIKSISTDTFRQHESIIRLEQEIQANRVELTRLVDRRNKLLYRAISDRILACILNQYSGDAEAFVTNLDCIWEDIVNLTSIPYTLEEDENISIERHWFNPDDFQDLFQEKNHRDMKTGSRRGNMMKTHVSIKPLSTPLGDFVWTFIYSIKNEGFDGFREYLTRKNQDQQFEFDISIDIKNEYVNEQFAEKVENLIIPEEDNSELRNRIKWFILTVMTGIIGSATWDGIKKIAGASDPEELIQGLIERLNSYNKGERKFELSKQLADSFPESAKAQKEYADTLYDKGEYERAKTIYEKAINLGRKDANTYAQYLVTLLNLKDFENSVKVYDKELEDSSGRFVDYLMEVYKEKVNLAGTMTKWSEGLEREDMERLIQLRPRDGALHFIYADFLYTANHVKEDKSSILKHHRHAIKLDADAPVRESYARFLEDQNQHRKAIRQYEAAVTNNPNDLDLQKKLIDITKNHQENSVGKHYEAAIKRHPDNDEIAKEYSDYIIERAKKYRRKNRLQKAARLYRKAIQLARNNEHAHYGYHLILNDLGFHQKANEHLNKAMEINPNIEEEF